MNNIYIQMKYMNDDNSYFLTAMIACGYSVVIVVQIH